MTIKLVKGDFNSLEEALLAQIKLMQDRIEELEKWEKLQSSVRQQANWLANCSGPR